MLFFNVIGHVKTFAGIILAGVVGMLILIIKAEQCYKKREVERRMESANNISLKAINRVIGKPQALRHIMEIDQYEEEKIHRRSMRQYTSGRLVKGKTPCTFNIFLIFHRMRGALLLALLLASAFSQNQITTVTDSTNLTAMNKTCAGAPISNLNICNNTCLECTSSSSYKCASCNTEFVLATDACLLDNSIHSYTYRSYLNALSADLMIKDLNEFIYADTGVKIGPNKVLEICKENTYEMFIAGPFKDTNYVGINYDYTDPIDKLQIKFNFMSLVQDVTLFIEVNDAVVFRNKFNIFSDLIGTYGKNPDNSGPNYLFLNALTSSNVQSVIAPVDTGVVSIISNAIRIRMFIVTKSPGYCWGFNDFVIIQRACETCPTKAVSDLLNNLGTLCYAVLAIVIGLMLLLFLMIKLEALKRKLDMEAKLGSSDSLPLKAMDRVIDSLQRSKKTMQKEFRREDRKHDKAVKGVKTLVKRE